MRTKTKKKTLAKLLNDCQTIFNKYIRSRDSEDGYFTCISCSRILPVDKMNAGHYVPVRGGSYLRFSELNTHGECEGCNCFDEFHLIGYRKNLIEKIGPEAVEWLELNRHTVKKYTRQEILDLIEKYK